MRRAIQHAAAGHWPVGEGAGTLTLDFDARHRRRLRLQTDAGEDVLLDLPKAMAMAEGELRQEGHCAEPRPMTQNDGSSPPSMEW